MAKNKNLDSGKASKPLGSAGTSIASGYFEEEHIDRLRGQDGAVIYDNIRRTDDTVGTMERAIKNPPRQATYRALPGTKGDKTDEEIADFFNWNFFDGGVMKKDWEDYLTDFLTIINFGFYIGAPEIAAVESPKHGWKWCLKDIGYRAQKTIERWNFNPDTQELESVHQNTTGSDLEFEGDIPVDQLVIKTLDREGDDYEGKSIYRNVIGNVDRKKLVDKIKIAGFERSALGIPHIKLSRDYDTKEEEKTAVTSAVKGLQAHKKCYIMTYDDVVIEMLKIEFDSEKADKIIKEESIRMLMTILADFLYLGHGSTGSWALMKGKSSMFLMSLMYIVNMYVSMINKLMKKLTIYNWGERENYPHLSVTGIKELSAQEEATIIKTLKDAGIMTDKDGSLQDFFRDKLGYPERSDEEKEAAKEAALKPAPVIPDPEGKPDKDKGDIKEGDKDDAEDKDNKEDIDNDDKEDDKEDKKKLAEVNFYRPLSIHEKKCDFKGICRDYDESSDDWNISVKNALNSIVEKYLLELRNALKQPGNPYKAVADTDIKSGVTEFNKLLVNNIKRIVIKGKNQASSEIKKKKFAEDDKFGPGLYTWVGVKAQDIRKSKLNDIEKIIKGTAISRLDATAGAINSVTQANPVVAAARIAIDDYLSKNNNLAGTKIIDESINKGRMDTFKQNKAEITGYEYSAILDDRVCPYCDSLDGQTREINDARSAEFDPPKHFGCRCVLVPIMGFEKQPEFGGFATNKTEVRPVLRDGTLGANRTLKQWNEGEAACDCGNH